jgi:UDP-N-acetyl-D-mannosaminuronate dehydrogenase
VRRRDPLRLIKVGIDASEVLASTFKEDCADLRNSKAVDIIDELKTCGVEVFVHDLKPLSKR